MLTKTPTPPSLLFTIPHPPTSPDDHPPSDSQFTDFLHALSSALPPSINTLYAAALANLAPDNTPELTSEMRASLTAAVTAFTVHLPPTEGEGRLDFLRGLAAGEVSGRELVSWADTVTAALRAFGSSDCGAATPPPPRTGPTARERTLTRDNHTCVITGGRYTTVARVVTADRVAVFWRFLGIFLGAEAVEALRKAIDVGEVANCMTVASEVRCFFEQGGLEIVPVVGSWAGREYDPCVVSSYDISIQYPAQDALRLYHCVYSTEPTPYILSSTPMAPGTTITLTTPDPSTMPLPHPLLLQLHAVCGRVKSLRAAAGWPVLQLGGESDGPETSSEWDRFEKAMEEEEGGMEEGEVEEEEVVVRSVVARYGMVSWADSVQRWVLGCCSPENVDPNLEPAVGTGGIETGERKDNKRKFGDIVEDREGEGEGEEAEEDRERPRKVTVVLDEMGMRERARWRLMTGRGGQRWLGV